MRARHRLPAETQPRPEPFSSDVLAGLALSQKRIPSRWLYDEHGSELFEEISRLDVYYLARTETGILRAFSRDIAGFCGENATLLEYGAGAGAKTELLIETLRQPRFYVPIDIAGDFLEHTVARFQRRFPELITRPITADFTADFAMPDWMPPTRRFAFFPGSTIGNLDADEVAAFLRRMRGHVGGGGRALIGVDLCEAPAILIPAYDDAAGVTARFNLNLLARINRELAGNFVTERFRHSVRWNESEAAVEMHLMSTVDQTVTVLEHRFDFSAGETIHTESSRKYRVADFTRIAGQQGWQVDRVWTDDKELFGVFGLSRYERDRLDSTGGQ